MGTQIVSSRIKEYPLGQTIFIYFVIYHLNLQFPIYFFQFIIAYKATFKYNIQYNIN